jgi:sugar phosphate isomerase/epimerase
MQLGIFARTFTRPTLAEIFDAVVAHELHCVQFNMACVGLPSLPDHIEDAVSAHIRMEASSRKISIAAVSGTYNMALNERSCYKPQSRYFLRRHVAPVPFPVRVFARHAELSCVLLEYTSKNSARSNS